MPRFGAAFMALLLLLLVVVVTSQVSAVLPPTNLSVRCQNLRVTVSWECSQRQQPTTFKVIVNGASNRLETETTECQYDLTSFFWGSETRYMDNYYVTVVAVEGGEQSEPVLSRTFSFNRVKTVDDMCFLDFPPVDVIENDSRVSASFANPFNFYPELKNALKRAGAMFSFSIVSNSSHFDGTCLASDETCKRDIRFTAWEETCVTLEGNLFDGYGVGQIFFKKTKHICVSKEPNMLMYVVPMAVGVLVIAVALGICCKYKAWTMQPRPLPRPLVFDKPNFGEHHERYHRVSLTDCTKSRITVQPAVPLEEEDQLQEPEPVPLDSSTSGGQDDDVVRSRNGSDYLEDGSDQLDTRSTSVCSDSCEESPYDRPQVCVVDLGDEEFADGYRE